jgi:hypothetical protein
MVPAREPLEDPLPAHANPLGPLRARLVNESRPVVSQCYCSPASGRDLSYWYEQGTNEAPAPAPIEMQPLVAA